MWRFDLLGGYPPYLVWPPGLGERVFQPAPAGLFRF